jgi:hypothetical protein
MEVSETLKKAWAAVEDAGLPDKIHEVAFREAVRLLVPAPAMAAISTAAVQRVAGSRGASGATGGGVSAGGTSGRASNDVGSDGDGSAIMATEDAILEKVATHTGVPSQKLENLVHLDDGVLKVSIPGLKLGRSTADQTRAIAQIITIVRGFGLDEAETSLELVRAEAQRLKCYDQANFSAQIKKLNGYLITGSGTNRRIRAKSAGIQAFPALVDGLLGES